MRILNRQEFLKLPKNTVYSKYKPCFFGAFEIKMDTWDNDFLVQEIAGAIECSETSDFISKLESNEHIKMDFDSVGRDGLYEDEQLFAVLDDEDVKSLIERLEKCIHTKEEK